MEIRERLDPRISVNKLGEYAATDNAARRRRIVRDQKKPKDYITPFYTDAQDFLADFLLDGGKKDQALLQKAEEFHNADASTPWWENKNQANADALVAFYEMADDLDLSEYGLRRGDPKPPKLDVQGVLISVRPELLLISSNRSGALIEGAVKLYINKNHPMSDEAGSYTATMLHQFVDTHPLMDGFCDYRSCYVVDVFAQRVFKAPRSFKQRRESIEAACEEIRRAWPEL